MIPTARQAPCRGMDKDTVTTTVKDIDRGLPRVGRPHVEDRIQEVVMVGVMAGVGVMEEVGVGLRVGGMRRKK